MDNIVYVRLDDWYDMGEATQYLEELMDGKHTDEINFSEVWYDMASIYCITTTSEYAVKHNLTKHIKDIDDDWLKTYYPEYDPTNFGCAFYGEFEGFAPYKKFNKELYDAAKNKGLIQNFCMTNQELINLLQQYPKDIEVMVDTSPLHRPIERIDTKRLWVNRTQKDYITIQLKPFQKKCNGIIC